MKKLIFFLLIAINLQAAVSWSGSGTKADPYLIGTVYEFCLLEADAGTEYAMDGGVWFKLTADIDLTDTMATLGYWNTIDGTGTETWNNHLDGDGYTVKGIKLSRDLTVTSTIRPCIFYGLAYPSSPSVDDTSNYIIRNITFDSTMIGGTWTGTVTYDIIFGILAGTISTSNIFNSAYAADSVVISNVYVDPTKPVIWNTWDEVCFGGMFGIIQNGARIRKCKVSGDIKLEFGTMDAITSGYRSGVIGGIGGAAYENGQSIEINQCVFEGRLEGIEGATNNGIGVGGILGNSRYAVQIYNCYTQANIVVTQDGGADAVNCVGGIYAWANNISDATITDLRACYVATDSVSDVTGGTDYAGLIYGLSAYGPEAYNVFADTTISVHNTLAGSSTSTADFRGDDDGSPTYGQLSTQIVQTTSWMQTQSNFETESPATNGYVYDFTDIWQIATADYPILQFEGAAAPSNTVTISAPTDGSNQIYPITVTWSGTGDYDSAYVNGVLVGDTTYTITTGANGALDIVVKLEADTTVYDSIQVNALISGTFLLDSAYATSSTLHYEVRFANISDTVRFLVGQDTVNMTSAGDVYVGSGYKDTTYNRDIPGDFWSTGEVWYKIITTEDSTDNYTIQDLNFVGQVGGTLICWNPSQSYAIEVLGQRDLSCGWQSGIERTNTTTSLRIPNDTTTDPYYTQSTDACASPYTGCTYSQRTFQAQDTSGGGSAVTTEKYSETTDYLKHGSRTATLNGRQYYLTDQKIYMDDITNSVDSAEIYDLSTYYDANTMIAPELWWFVYHTEITDTIQHDGTIDTELPARPYPLIVIYEDDGFQRMWSFDAYAAPRSYSQVLHDSFLATESIVAHRDYFRGIDPKFVRDP